MVSFRCVTCCNAVRACNWGHCCEFVAVQLNNLRCTGSSSLSLMTLAGDLGDTGCQSIYQLGVGI